MEIGVKMAILISLIVSVALFGKKIALAFIEDYRHPKKEHV